MPDGGLETLVGQRSSQPALAEHRHGLDVDQMGAVTWSAARNSPRAAFSASWSSARALARMEASTTITARSPGRSAPRAFFVHVGHGRLQADATAMLRFDLVEDLADRALLGEVTQLDSEVLLQRLVPALGLALQSGVHVLGDVADQNMRRACRCWSLQGVALSLEDLLAVIAVVGTEVV